MKTATYRWVLGVITAVALALRVAWVQWVARPPVGPFIDPSRYLGMADQIARGHGMVEPFTGSPTAYYPPGYPWFVGIVQWTTAPFTSEVWRAVGLVQAGLGAGCVLLVAMVTRRLAGPVPALVAAGLFAIYPNLVFHSGAVMGETLYNTCFLAFLAVVFARPWGEGFTVRRAVACGVLLGLAIMVRPISVAVIPVLVCCWALAHPDRGTLVRRSGLLLAGIAVCVLPWTVRNAIRMQAFVPLSTNTGDNLCIGHASGATGAFGVLDSCKVPYRFLDGRTAEVKSDRAKQAIARSAILHHPGREPWLLWRRVYFTWIRDGDHDGLFAVESYRRDPWMAHATEARLIRVADRIYWVVAAAGVVGLVGLARRREPEPWFFVGATLATAAIPLLFFGDSRFKVPAIPLLIVAAATLVPNRQGPAEAGASPIDDGRPGVEHRAGDDGRVATGPE